MNDVLENAALSGEPLVPQIQPMFENGPRQPIAVPEYHNNTLRLQDYRARYQDYWSSTADKSGTGKQELIKVIPSITSFESSALGHILAHMQVDLWML